MKPNDATFQPLHPENPIGLTGYMLDRSRRSGHKSARIYIKGSEILVELEWRFVIGQYTAKTQAKADAMVELHIPFKKDGQ